MTSRRRVFLITTIPILGCILLFCLGYALHHAHGKMRKQATETHVERVRLANEKHFEEFNQVVRSRSEGRISPEESMKVLQESGEALGRETISADEEWVNAGLSTSWQKVAYFAIGAPLLLPIILIIRVLWHVRGRLLLNELRRRGYDFLTMHDALWLALIMPRRAFRVPSASDYLTLPGSSPDIRGLIAFLRRKR